MSETAVPEPPEAPEMPRLIRLGILQLIGIPLLMIVPLLAAFGVFGQSTATATASAGRLEVSVEHPSLIRYESSVTIDMALRNTSTDSLEDVTVTLDREYLNAFSGIAFSPEPSDITEQAYVVSVPKIGSGETRRISVDVRAQSYWRHEGVIRVSGGGRPLAELRFSTFILP